MVRKKQLPAIIKATLLRLVKVCSLLWPSLQMLCDVLNDEVEYGLFFLFFIFHNSIILWFLFWTSTNVHFSRHTPTKTKEILNKRKKNVSTHAPASTNQKNTKMKGAANIDNTSHFQWRLCKWSQTYFEHTTYSAPWKDHFVESLVQKL